MLRADDPAVHVGTFAQVAAAWSRASSLETLVRPLLDTVLGLTSLDIAYLTVKHADDGLEHRFIADPTGLGVPEGLTIPWEESLCKRCEDAGLRWTGDVARDLGESPAAAAFGLRTFVSVPVVSHAGTVMGTLCSAARDAHALSDSTLAELEVLARLMGDWMVFERDLAGQRQRADAAEQALDTRAMLIARAEHELKTPLALLSGWAQVMDERWSELESAERQAGLSALRRGTERLHHYVERLLDEARADMLIRRLEAVQVDVGVIASAVAGEVAAVAADHVISVVVHPPTAAVGDEEGIRQIVVHLLENAVKYSPHGGAVDVSVATDRDVLVVNVRDEGIGVNDEVDIFAPFVRGVASGDPPGSGLGLHIVKSFAVAMGGSIEARRNSDQIGSTFTVRLPVWSPR